MENNPNKEQKEQLFTVILFYHYVDISNHLSEVLLRQRTICERLELCGRLRLADEGVNGTLAGSDKSITSYITEMAVDPWFAGMPFKKSFSAYLPFSCLKVVQVSELAMSGKMRKSDLDRGGVHLSPREFHEQLCARNPETSVLLDVRNSFETAIGMFEGATDPKTRLFTQFPHFAQQNLPALINKKVFMYCTGGIRCEKASAYLKQQGVNEVYQLQGGIHEYLEAFPDGGLFRGENYVFDNRSALSPLGESSHVVGKCTYCTEPWGRVDEQLRCDLCAYLTLICDSCLTYLRQLQSFSSEINVGDEGQLKVCAEGFRGDEYDDFPKSQKPAVRARDGRLERSGFPVHCVEHLVTHADASTRDRLFARISVARLQSTHSELVRTWHYTMRIKRQRKRHLRLAVLHEQAERIAEHLRSRGVAVASTTWLMTEKEVDSLKNKSTKSTELFSPLIPSGGSQPASVECETKVGAAVNSHRYGTTNLNRSFAEAQDCRSTAVDPDPDGVDITDNTLIGYRPLLNFFV